mmetsp:Transcript_2048/g.4096  ORF Transcript_2048/g.4096 Transcript_2048/m.4096 type:complete len:84 (-) Transcript_2048:196-447(-)
MHVWHGPHEAKSFGREGGTPVNSDDNHRAKRSYHLDHRPISFIVNRESVPWPKMRTITVHRCHPHPSSIILIILILIIIPSIV